MQTNEILQFRRCNINQINILHQIAILSYKENYTQIWHDDGKAYLERFYDISLLEAELADYSCTFYLIYQQETPIGFFKLRANALPPYPTSNCLELNKIYFLQAYTGTGMGQKTLQFIINLARAEQRSILWLNVMEESKARTFYERNAFERVKQVTLEYPFIKDGLNILSTYKLDLHNSK